MTRPYVVTPIEHARVPFLRGILTRSLQDADLSFEEAYEVASQIRLQLQDETEIDAEELRERVARLLQERFGAAVAERYRAPAMAAATTILVENRDGQLMPFSRGLHMHFLGSSGLTPDEAARVTNRIFEHLLRMGVERIATSRLSYLTYLALRKSLGARAADNFVVWSAFVASGRPLIILIGGTIGCGKSTFLRSVNRINERLGYVRIEGSIDVMGENIYAPDVELLQVRKQVGMVFQRPNPLPLSIRDNVLFGYRLHAARDPQETRDEDEVLEQALRQVLLWDKVKDQLSRRATELSLEEQQKLCIARLLPVKPRVLLMDEPCSALDPKGTEAVEELIWDLRGRVHDPDRHPQHGPGPAGERGVHLHAPRQGDRARAHGRDVRDAEAQGNRRLHRRPLRLNPAGPFPYGSRTPRSPGPP